MKTVLLTAAAMGLSISAASADCARHSNISASVDTETTVASVVKQVPPAPAAEPTKAEEATQAE